jgi:uncharacterized protein YjbI with pentapeptide repeats
VAGRRARDGWLSDERITSLDALDAGDVEDDAQLEAVALRDADLAELDVSHVELRECALERVGLRDATMARLVTDSVRLDDCDLANARWTHASLSWTEFRSSRATGFDLAEASFRHVVFRGCRLDLASLRFVEGESVRFEDCTLHEADLTGAVLHDAVFAHCELQGVDLTSADLDGTDLTTSTLADVRGVGGLRGTCLRADQLVTLAPALAAHVGIRIDETS